jgi:3'(2'), 5'-bisphosphate nucleotidase
MGTTASNDDISAALAAVQQAAVLCDEAQGRLVAGETLTKSDDSPVTVADFAAQAVVCAVLEDRLGDVRLVGEEDPADLADPDQAPLRDGVNSLVSAAFGRPVTDSEITQWIDIGSAPATGDRYWTLDPIDGTKGFLRGDQYAIALGLIEHGRVVLGVLGCPNLPNADGSRGAIFVGANESATMYTANAPDGVPVRVDDPDELSDARFCESVESGHSDQSQSAQIAAALGIETEPFRIDSQCKYAAVARGDAAIYLRLPTRADYQEKIWDHAAGAFVVEQAGGRVTDVNGLPLDFSVGSRLSENSGVVATSGRHHDEVIAAVKSVLG